MYHVTVILHFILLTSEKRRNKSHIPFLTDLTQKDDYQNDTGQWYSILLHDRYGPARNPARNPARYPRTSILRSNHFGHTPVKFNMPCIFTKTFYKDILQNVLIISSWREVHAIKPVLTGKEYLLVPLATRAGRNIWTNIPFFQETTKTKRTIELKVKKFNNN